MTDNPEFEEGPFFLVTDKFAHKRYIGWASDAFTAASIPKIRTDYPNTLLRTEFIGDLNAVKEEFHLTPSQVGDLHREGYLRL